MLDSLPREANTALPLVDQGGKVATGTAVPQKSLAEHSLVRLLPSLLCPLRRFAVPRSVLEAIKQGDWNFEPTGQQPVNVKATAALPGTAEKLDVLAERLKLGLPLWHEDDRLSYDDRDKD
jgi:hypothetical protein